MRPASAVHPWELSRTRPFAPITVRSRSASRDDRARFFGKRSEGGKDAKYLTLSEEKLAIGKRAVKQGEVGIHKEVETRHVKEQVPTMHEEVTIERRPARADASSSAQIGEDKIVIPVMGEEVVVDKRTVPVEEIVISKSAVRGSETVEADLKRETIDVERKGRAKDSADDRR